MTRKKRADIVDEAERVLGEMAKGELSLADLSTRERSWLREVLELCRDDEGQAAVLAFLRGRSRSEEIGAAVARWEAFKTTEAGEVTPHHERERAVVREVAEEFAGRRVAEIALADLHAWWSRRGERVGPKRRKDLRAALVAFWAWARRENMTGNDPLTVAERLPTVKVPKASKEVLDPAALVALLNGIEIRWRAWVVLQAWGGLRPEEACPSKNSKKAEKRGLYCEEIDWDFGVIRLPAEVSKVGGARIIPMNPALRAGLAWAGIEAGQTGPVCLWNPSDEKMTAVWGRELLCGRWPKDALRHSYGSYRNALIRNLATVAEEMGTSEAMLHRHYHNPRAEAEGRGWFEGVVLKSSEIGEVWVVESRGVPAGKRLSIKDAS